jgi:hypothetical protein
MIPLLNLISCSLILSDNGDDPGLSTQVNLINSQLRGELQQKALQKGLQPMTLSLYNFAARLLFPVIAFR